MAQREGTRELAAVVAGDEIAFRRLIAAHHDDLRRVCAYIAGDLAIAEDATEAAWVVAWKRLHDMREPSHLRPWLITVAANEAKKLLRTRRRQGQFEVAIRFVSSSPEGIPA